VQAGCRKHRTQALTSVRTAVSDRDTMYAQATCESVQGVCSCMHSGRPCALCHTPSDRGALGVPRGQIVAAPGCAPVTAGKPRCVVICTAARRQLGECQEGEPFTSTQLVNAEQHSQPACKACTTKQQSIEDPHCQLSAAPCMVDPPAVAASLQPSSGGFPAALNTEGALLWTGQPWRH
jgi:hypothetical protein